MSDLLGAINKHLLAQDSGDNTLFTVKSSGAYVGRVNLSYKVDGNSFSQDIGGITAGTTHTLKIPATATNINMKAEACVFFGVWNTIVDRNVEPVDNEITLKIGGTTLNTNWNLEKGILK